MECDGYVVRVERVVCPGCLRCGECIVRVGCKVCVGYIVCMCGV